jgi:hypothetical protein
MKKYLLIGSIGLNILFVCFFLYKKNNRLSHKSSVIDSTITYTINKFKYFDHKKNMYRYFKGQDQDIVFIGNSLIDNYPLSEMFKNEHVRNRGMSGETTTDLLNRIDESIKYNPKKVFIMDGINDIGVIPMQLTIENLKNVISKIKLKSPNTIIYLQSILPVSDIAKTRKVIEYNKALKQIDGIVYIELFDKMVEGNKINPNLTFDGTHLTLSGYLIWTNQIKQYVN